MTKNENEKKFFYEPYLIKHGNDIHYFYNKNNAFIRAHELHNKNNCLSIKIFKLYSIEEIIHKNLVGDIIGDINKDTYVYNEIVIPSLEDILANLLKENNFYGLAFSDKISIIDDIFSINNILNENLFKAFSYNFMNKKNIKINTLDKLKKSLNNEDCLTSLEIREFKCNSSTLKISINFFDLENVVFNFFKKHLTV